MPAADKDRRYKTSQWQRTRKAILNAAGWVCQIRSPNCTVQADQVDHIVEVTKGGSFFDPANLRAACNNCNQRRRRRKPSTTVGRDHTPSRPW